MTTRETLERLYPGRISEPKTAQDIRRNVYIVYILTHNDNPIVVGHGKHNRAKVIFDDKNQITSGHIKSIFIRAYRLFGHGMFEQFLIVCDNKNEAQVIEARVHENIGGNTRDLPADIGESLLRDISQDSIAGIILRIALLSSFDGISDLKMWRKKGILDDKVWEIIGKRLQLDDPK